MVTTQSQKKSLSDATLNGSMAGACAAVGLDYDTVQRFANAQYLPLPKQIYFHAAAHECDTRGGNTVSEVGLGGARGGAKSHGVLAQLALDDCQRQDQLKSLFLRQVGVAARESLEDLIPKVVKIPHRYTASPVPTIKFPNGSRILVGHFKNENDINRYLGLEYDVIATEEATQLSASKNAQIGTCLRTSKPDWKPRRYYSTNPGGVGHSWFKKKFIEPYRRNTEVSTRFIPSTFRDNPYLNKEYVEMLNGLTGWLRRAWRDGDWDIFAGQYFSTFSYEDHVIEPRKLPNPIPDTWTVWCSLDYGFTHFTVCHLLAEFDGTVYFIDEHSARKTTVPVHAEAIKAMLSRHGVKFYQLANFSAGTDVFAQRGAASGETIADQYEKEGIRLTPANTDRINGAAKFLELLGDKDKGIDSRLKISTRCPVLIEQLPAMQHNPKKPEDVLKMDADDHGTGGDDAYDSGRYGVMTDNSLGILI